MPKNIVIVGPTACGKSQMAIDLVDLYRTQKSHVDKFPTSIISLDSMQIYKGMEIGTGVVPEAERKDVKHHMISFISPTLKYNVKEFQEDVYTILDSNKKDSFVLVGGTGLYTHAVIDGFSFAPSSEDIRKQIIEEYQLDENDPNEVYVKRAYETLRNLDSQAAERIDPKNVRRIIRALEAIEISGEKFSESGEGVQAFGDPKIDVEMIGLRYSRENLRKRIEFRVDEMFRSGWIDEVKKLLPIWGEIVTPAKNAIGYIPIRDWILNGERTSGMDDLKDQIINRTAQFSRRQRKWFERDPRIKWIDCDGLNHEEILELLY